MLKLYRPSQSVQWSWITLAGPDAKDFLHRLTTVNVRELAVGQGAPGFFLTAQGKVRAYFNLWSYGEGEYAFELDAGGNQHWKNELLTAIDQMTFAEKMTLTDITPVLGSAWILADTDQEINTALGTPIAPGHTIALDDEIRVSHHGHTEFGQTWITAWGRPERLDQWLDRTTSDAKTLSWSELDTLRIQAMRPWVGHEIHDSTIPLEVGLRGAIADNKGCYPGQEVIERIISLGSPARRLSRIEGQGAAPQLGSKILNIAEPAVEVGEVTSVAATPTGFTALGLIRKIHAKEGLDVRFENSASGSICEVAPYA